MNYQFSADLIADILFRAGEPTDGTSDFDAIALKYLNRAYQALVMGGGEVDSDINEDWWWARKHPPGVLNLIPEITLGTLTATNNSTSITFTNAPAASVVGYFIRIGDHPDLFRIATHTAAATAATLDAAFTGTTGASQTFHLFKAEYDLASDVVRVISPMRIYQGTLSEVDGTELMSLERDHPLREIQAGAPLQFALVTERKIRFSHYGPASDTTPNMIRVEYDYIYRPADLTDSGSEEPIVPLNYRKLLTDIALTFLFVDKNDDRASSVSGLAKKGLQAMENEQRSRMVNYSRNYGTLYPRPEKRTSFRHPLRTDSGFIIG